MPLIIRPVTVRMPRKDIERDPTAAQIQFALRDQCNTTARCPVVVEIGLHGGPIANNCPATCDMRSIGGILVRTAQPNQQTIVAGPEVQQQLV